MDVIIPLNPLRELREKLGLTQKDLAEAIGQSDGKILRDEQFMYVEPNEFTVQYLADHTDYAVERIRDLYLKARDRLHSDFFMDLRDQPFYTDTVRRAVDYATDYYDAGPSLRSPIKLFREQLFIHYGLPDSAIKFCMYTGMHQATLSDIETGKTDWSGCASFCEVLTKMGVNNGLQNNLGVLHDDFFVRRINV